MGKLEKVVKVGLEVVKVGGGLVISAGVGTLTANVIKSTTPESTSKLSIYLLNVGSYAAGGLAAAAAAAQWANKVDNIEKVVRKGKEKIDQIVAEEEKVIVKEGA